MRKLWVAAAIVIVLAVAAVLAYREFAPAAPEQPVATETPATETPATGASTTGASATGTPAGEAPAAGTAGVDSATPPETPPATVTPAAGAAEMPEIRPDDRVLGEPGAPVTIIEYASLTCPHCAAFHTETLPQLKSAYIETGKVRLVFRDFPLDGIALRASMLARCMPEDRYFPMLDVLFRSQVEWARAEDPIAALSQIGRTAGLPPEKVESCLNDEAAMDTIIAGTQAAEKEFDVRSTPTLIINGESHAGALSFAQLEEILKDELPE